MLSMQAPLLSGTDVQGWYGSHSASYMHGLRVPILSFHTSFLVHNAWALHIYIYSFVFFC